MKLILSSKNEEGDLNQNPIKILKANFYLNKKEIKTTIKINIEIFFKIKC